MNVPFAASFALFALFPSLFTQPGLSRVEGDQVPCLMCCPGVVIDTTTHLVSPPRGPLLTQEAHVCPSPLGKGWHRERVTVPPPGHGDGGSDGALGSATNGSRVQVLSEFDGTDQLAPQWFPADPDLAVSGTHVVEVVNENIAFFTKTGTMTYSNLLGSNDPGSSGFFEAAGAQLGVFDPKVVYDAESGCFFVVAVEKTATESFLYIAVSDDSDPNGVWFTWQLNALGGGTYQCLNNPVFPIPQYTDFLDYPSVAVDSQAVYVTGNRYVLSMSSLCSDCPTPMPPPPVHSLCIGHFAGTRITIFDKAMLLGGVACAKSINQGYSNEDPANIQAAESLSASSSTYLVNTQYDGIGSTIRIGYVDDPLNNPEYIYTDVPVPQFLFPGEVGVPQAGTSILLDPSDARIMNAVWRDDELYFTHAVYDDVAGKILARWYQYDTTTQMLTQVGEIDPGAGVHTFFPAIAVDGQHEVGMVFARSSATEFPSIAMVARRPSDPPGTMSPPKFLQQSATYYESSGAGGNARWGDYFGIAADPGGNSRKFWCVGEWASSSSHWETRIGHFKLAKTQML